MREAIRFLLISSALAAVASAYSGDIATLELRLKSPVTSYKTKRGASFESVLIAPCVVGNRVLLPVGTIVRGGVKRRHQVGIGFLHERAGVDLDFYEYKLPDGRTFPMSGRLLLIENARETVNKEGHIQGVLAADNPQRWLDGLWNRPSVSLVQHSLLGLTGMTGRAFTFFELGPIGGAALIAARITLFSLPEPEIRLPAGTEMKVSLISLPEGSPQFPVLQETAVPNELKEWLKSQAADTFKPNGHASQDIINVGFVGTREQVINAFQAAGWTQALPRTPRSLSHLWHSFATQTGYVDAPASPMLYRGAEPEMLFEKSLNTIAMRDHVRIWRTDSTGHEVWLGAATHDVALGFDSHEKKFIHKIDPRIDFERGKIVNDLAFAGCAEPVGYVTRPAVVRESADTKTILSDGRLAVVTLRDCAVPAVVPDPEASKPLRSVYVRSVRRVVLETRQYILRENPYYWGFRAWQWNRTRSQEPAFVDY